MMRRAGLSNSGGLESRGVLHSASGLAALWIFAFLAVPSADASAAESGTVLRAGSLGSLSARPLRRQPPQAYHGGSTPYGFLNIGGGVFDPSNQVGDGFYGVLAAGTEAAAPLDLGIQISWFHRGSHGEEFKSSYADPAGNRVEQTVVTQSVDTDLLPFMGIARLRFPIDRHFQPFVGAGVGYEWLSVEGVDQFGYPFSNDYGGFGAQGMAGFNLAMRPTTALYGEAVYNLSTVTAEFYDPFYGVVIRESVDYDGWAFHGGLRFRF